MYTLFSLSKSGTLTALNLSESLLLLFGLLLVVGLIGEYAESDRWKKYVKVFEMCVIIGVAGELFADGGIFLFSSRLQTIADLEIAALSIEAGNAKESAEGAAAASSRAESSSKEANAEAGRAKDSAEAAVKASEEAKRNLELTQFLVSARTVNNRDALIEQLKQFKGLPVVFRSYIGDAEGWGLCTTLLNIAHSAEMNPTDECGKWPATVPTITEINVVGPDDNVMKSLSEAVSRTGRLGVSSGPYGNAPHSPTLIILIGVKSPFSVGQAPPKRRKH
jgi:hypothetical protein